MEAKKAKRSRRTSGQMYPLMEAYAVGGQGQRAFCAQHGLTASVFQYWWRRYREDGAAERGGFVALVPEVAPASGVELHFGPVRLCLGDAPAGYVAELVRQLAGRC